MWPSGQVPDQSEFAGAGDRIGAIVHIQFLVGTLDAFFGGGASEYESDSTCLV
jgi:hypothetical protein